MGYIQCKNGILKKKKQLQTIELQHRSFLSKDLICRQYCYLKICRYIETAMLSIQLEHFLWMDNQLKTWKSSWSWRLERSFFGSSPWKWQSNMATNFKRSISSDQLYCEFISWKMDVWEENDVMMYPGIFSHFVFFGKIYEAFKSRMHFSRHSIPFPFLQRLLTSKPYQFNPLSHVKT